MVQMNPSHRGVVKKAPITATRATTRTSRSARSTTWSALACCHGRRRLRRVRLALRHQALRRLRVRVNIATHAESLWSDESGVTYDQAGIWQSGGGIMSDGSGRIFLTSGNGVSPAKRAGTSPGGQLAESVIRLAVTATGRCRPRTSSARPTPRRWTRPTPTTGPAGRSECRSRRPATPHSRPDRQGRPDLAAQPEQPRRARAGIWRHRQRPVRDQGLRRRVGPPGDLRRHRRDHRELSHQRCRQRLPVLGGQGRRDAGVPVSRSPAQTSHG